MIKLILLLAILSSSFVPGPTIEPVKYHDITATLHMVIDGNTTIFYDYAVPADTVINLTGKIPKHKEIYILIKTK